METLISILAIVVWVVILGGAFCAIDETNPRYLWDLLVGSRIRHWQDMRAWGRRQ